MILKQEQIKSFLMLILRPNPQTSMCLQSKHMCELSRSRTMHDLVLHDGLFITTMHTHIHKAAIVASKSWINLQTRTRSRCEGTWRILLRSSSEIKNQKTFYLLKNWTLSRWVTWPAHAVSHVGSCSTKSPVHLLWFWMNLILQTHKIFHWFWRLHELQQRTFTVNQQVCLFLDLIGCFDNRKLISSLSK